MGFFNKGKAGIFSAALGLSLMAGSLIGGTGVGAAPAGGAGVARMANISCWCDSFVTTADLNHRSGKGTNYSVLQVIPQGAEITVSLDPADNGNGFFKAHYNGTWGWVHGDYITEPGNSGPSAGFYPVGTAVTTDSVNFREGPGTNFDVLDVLSAGTEVEYMEDVADGFRSVLYNGKDGWIFEGYLDFDGSNGPSAGFPGVGASVTNDSVNLRQGPGTSYAVLDVLAAGTEVEISDETADGFRYVRYNGQDGWIFDAYLGGNSGPSASFPAAGTTTTNDSVNFREGPGTNYASLDYLDAGTEVTFSNEVSNGFRYVKINGVDGWVFDIYLN